MHDPEISPSTQVIIYHKNRNYNIPHEANEVCSALYPKRFLPSSPREHTTDVLNMRDVVITIFMVFIEMAFKISEHVRRLHMRYSIL